MLLSNVDALSNKDEEEQQQQQEDESPVKPVWDYVILDEGHKIKVPFLLCSDISYFIPFKIEPKP